MKKYTLLIIFKMLLFGLNQAYAAGDLSKNIRIESEVLGYSLQYRVYTPDGMAADGYYPTIYVADGPEYIKYGGMVSIMDSLIAEGLMKPVIAVFVDARDPDDLRKNRRNKQYCCNEDFAKFFISEMIATIENNYPVSRNNQDRVIQGASAGGVNAACFGIMATDEFGGLSVHSPGNQRFLRKMGKEYAKNNAFPIKIFMSVGNNYDNRKIVRRFKSILDKKGYDMNFIQNSKDHGWSNWGPLIDDALLTFFATD